MELEEIDKNQGNLIKELLKSEGDIKEEIILDWFNTGKVLKVISQNEIIGFVKLEIFDFDCVFHLFLIPKKRNSILGFILLKKVLDYCFNSLHIKRVFTFAKGKEKMYLDKLKIMQEAMTSKPFFDYTMYVKERKLCQQYQQ